MASSTGGVEITGAVGLLANCRNSSIFGCDFGDEFLVGGGNLD
jgi:hypothetical protein